MHDPHTNERQLIAPLLDTLRALPRAHADLDQLERPPTKRDKGYGAKIILHLGDQTVILLIEAKKSFYPRDAQQALWKLQELRHQLAGSTEESVPLLVAETISPGTKELLREEGIGYFDSGGSLFLPARSAYLFIDKPPPKKLSKSIRTLFAGRRAQVLHTLLLRRDRWFGVKELAAEASVSPATASQVLGELERFDWLDTRGQGPTKERYLREPSALLDTWAKQISVASPPALHRYYVPSMKAEQLLQRIGQIFAARGVGYAVSYEAAAQRYAPFLSSISQVRCRLMLDTAAEAALSELGGRVVNEGANLAIIEAKSSGELLFREQIDGVWLASPIQVYLDLLRGEGRAKEMAQHLRQERIGF